MQNCQPLSERLSHISSGKYASIYKLCLYICNIIITRYHSGESFLSTTESYSIYRIITLNTRCYIIQYNKPGIYEYRMKYTTPNPKNHLSFSLLSLYTSQYFTISISLSICIFLSPTLSELSHVY